MVFSFFAKGQNLKIYNAYIKWIGIIHHFLGIIFKKQEIMQIGMGWGRGEGVGGEVGWELWLECKVKSK